MIIWKDKAQPWKQSNSEIDPKEMTIDGNRKVGYMGYSINKKIYKFLFTQGTVWNPENKKH